MRAIDSLSSYPEFYKRYRHQPFEVYKLEKDRYQLQQGEPFWMPEVGLGIGRFQAEIAGFSQDILTWYDEMGHCYLSIAEQEQQRANLERKRADQERQQRQRLETYLRSQGIDPNQLPEF